MRTPALKIGLPLRVIVWFARFPDEELSTTEIKERFKTDDVYARLRQFIDTELLSTRRGAKFRKGGGMQSENYYSAGKRLREMIKKYEVS
jgi:hypothetical protein